MKTSYLQGAHDELARLEPIFAPGVYVLIERLQLTTSPAERLAAEGYTKLLPRRLGRYPIISVGPKFVKLWQYRIKNTGSINLISQAPRKNYNDDIFNRGARAKIERQPPEPRKEHRTEYGVEKLVGQKKSKTEYAIACNGMTATQLMIRMNFRRTFRRTSSIAPGIGKLAVKKAARWHNEKALTKTGSANGGQQAIRKPNKRAAINKTSNLKPSVIHHAYRSASKKRSPLPRQDFYVKRLIYICTWPLRTTTRIIATRDTTNQRA